MDAIRLGFVGLGGICRQRHVPGFRAIEGVRLAAVANRTLASSDVAARAFDIADVCGTWQELVARDDIDAVVIGTWPYMHREVSIAALESGKHVFCQARMAMDAEEAREMRDAARASARVAALCPVPIGLSVDRTILRLAREGALGPIRLVRVQSLSGANLDPDTPLHWRKDHRLSGLNVLTLGMYVEVIHRWFGMTRTVSAMSQLFTCLRRDASGADIEVRIPDQVLVNAMNGEYTAVQYIISGMARHGRDAIEIYGQDATLHYDVGADTLYQAIDGGRLEPVERRPEEAYDVAHWTVERDFIEAIRTGAAYHPDFEDGYRYMSVVQAVHDSAVSGGVVNVTAR